jgi:hypothetical protein
MKARREVGQNWLLENDAHREFKPDDVPIVQRIELRERSSNTLVFTHCRHPPFEIDEYEHDPFTFERPIRRS